MQPKTSFRAKKALEFLFENKKFDSVLDIGAGYGIHTNEFRKYGKNVTPTDMFGRVDGLVVGNYMDLDFEPHDLTWASHILEHQPNAHAFLKKLRKETKTGGITCVTVPPLKHNIVGGHVSLWNAGLLLYNLVLAGFDCKNAHIKTYGYNISIIAYANEFELPSNLEFGSGDIDKLKPWLPSFVEEKFDGIVDQWNWN
jgi:SAM-dependent methyltransferase